MNATSTTTGEARLLATGGEEEHQQQQEVDPAMGGSGGGTRISDGITALRYVGNTLLASSSWDGCVRIHDTTTTTTTAIAAGSKGNNSVVAVCSLNSPVLSLAVPVDGIASEGGRGASATATTSPVDFDRTTSRMLPLLDSSDEEVDDDAGGPFFFAGTLDGSIYRLDLFKEDEEEEEEGAVVSWSLRSTLVGRHPQQGSGCGSGGTEDPPQDHKQAAKCLAAMCFSAVVPHPHQEQQKQRLRCWVASAGWDGRWYLWEGGRSSTSSRTSQVVNLPHPPLCQLPLPGKAFDMDSCAVAMLAPDGGGATSGGGGGGGTAAAARMRCVVATSGRRVCVVDVAAAAPPASSTASASIVLDRESSLKYQTRTIRFFPGGSGIALGCIEGRVAIEYLTELGVDPPADGSSSSGGVAKKYAFKCHRKGDLVFPVNCIEFHRGSPCTLATGGCDGEVILWNGLAKRRLAPLLSCPTSVSALAFHPLGTELAVASSYTFEQGEYSTVHGNHPQAPPRNEIYLRALLASEFQPKSKD